MSTDLFFHTSTSTSTSFRDPIKDALAWLTRTHEQTTPSQTKRCHVRTGCRIIRSKNNYTLQGVVKLLESTVSRCKLLPLSRYCSSSQWVRVLVFVNSCEPRTCYLLELPSRGVVISEGCMPFTWNAYAFGQQIPIPFQTDPLPPVNATYSL